MKNLHLHANTGLIQHAARRLYVNPRARSLPGDVLPQLADRLRPWDFNYLSLESVLSDSGWISQVPARLTLMSSGRSQTVATPYGTLEFTQTRRARDGLVQGIEFDPARGLKVASAQRAFQDLKKVGRSLDLVQVPMDEAA